MNIQVDHHVLALLTISNACLELVHIQTKTDAIVELQELLEAQWDIVDCIIHSRHFGSDGLDDVIRQCETVVEQVREFEEK